MAKKSEPNKKPGQGPQKTRTWFPRTTRSSWESSRSGSGRPSSGRRSRSIESCIELYWQIGKSSSSARRSDGWGNVRRSSAWAKTFKSPSRDEWILPDQPLPDAGLLPRLPRTLRKLSHSLWDELA